MYFSSEITVSLDFFLIWRIFSPRQSLRYARAAHIPWEYHQFRQMSNAFISLSLSQAVVRPKSPMQLPVTRIIGSYILISCYFGIPKIANNMVFSHYQPNNTKVLYYLGCLRVGKRFCWYSRTVWFYLHYFTNASNCIIKMHSICYIVLYVWVSVLISSCAAEPICTTRFLGAYVNACVSM